MSTDTSAAGNAGRSRVGEIAIIGVMAIALFAIFIWLSGSGGTQDTAASSGSSNSEGPRGTLALYRWLQKSGFEVSRAGPNDAFPPDADTLVMVNPTADFGTGQAADVKRWVEEGHTLVLAASGLANSNLLGGHPMLKELGVDLQFSQGFTTTVPVAQPIFPYAGVGSVKMPGLYTLSLPLTGTSCWLRAARRRVNGCPLRR